MNERHVPYVVAGAFALQRHTGIWRDTKDLDLFLPPEGAAQALQVLAEDRFETTVADPVWLAKAHRGEYYVDLITGMSNGVVTVDRSWIERGTVADVLGVETRILGAEELIASKLFVTRRERFDGADICHVIYRTRGQLDWQRLLGMVAGHEDLLLWALVLFAYVYPADADYVPGALWQKLLQDFQEHIRRPDATALFRGSLVDPMMFAIDVEEWGLPNLGRQYRERRVPKIGVKQKIDPAA